MEQEKIKEYFHEDLNQEVQSIGGRYVLTTEKKLLYNDQEILYLTGHAIFDSTCCGAGGCVYAVVYGIIVNWKQKKKSNGSYISEVISIRNEEAKKTIQQMIMEKESINQVIFL
jgi:hypothetical protein